VVRFVLKNSPAEIANHFALVSVLASPSTMTASQPNNLLHGITLEVLLNDLVSAYGWEELGRRIPVRCFTHDPSISSSLKFLRRTPWARERVESLYLDWQTSGKNQ
jgi:uncharacterized protein (DUF2132 family)